MLEDFHDFGAIHETQLTVRYGANDVDTWLRQRLLQKLPTRIGPAFILGAKGREHLGLSRNYTASPDRALDHIVQRCVLADLPAFQLARFASDNVMVVEGERPYFIAAKWTPYRSRSVKELLRKHKHDLLSTGATLVIVTPKPYTLRKFAHPLLEIWNLKDIRAWQDLIGLTAS
jgi:hypothetical protein